MTEKTRIIIPQGSGDAHHMPVRIYYEDTDFSGVVYHASYLRFFERGRTEFIRALGIDQQAMYRADSIAFAVRSITVDYLKPALMDDVIDIETRVALLRRTSLQLVQTIRRHDEILTTAQVLVVCVRQGRPQRIPEQLWERLEANASFPPVAAPSKDIS